MVDADFPERRTQIGLLILALLVVLLVLFVVAYSVDPWLFD
ncbi:MAG: hypothetical protein R3324_20280 [Halobacteriales archaeon]|nr:hypothetical protein [Halobacteriales archaeon]